MKFFTKLFCSITLVSGVLFGQEHVGALPDGGYLLNNGWTVRPMGDVIPVGAFPMSSAVSADGKYVLVLSSNATHPGISVVDILSRKELSRTPLPDAWLGLIAAPSSNLIYAGGGSSGKVYEFSLGPDGALSHTREFAIETAKTAGAPFVGDVALSPDARMLYAADLHGDTIASVNLQSGKTVDHWKTGRRPYRILVSPNGAQLLVSSWAEGAVYIHQSGTGVLITKLRVGAHPTEMLWINKAFTPENNGAAYRGRLFVSASNTNSVFSFGVTQDDQFSMLDPVNVAMTAMHPLGMTPAGLATDANGTRLFIACSDANVVALADLTNPRMPVTGFIPTGWYPTSVQVLANNQFAALNGKANSVQLATVPSADRLTAATKTALANSPFRDEMLRSAITDPAEAAFSRTQERPSPIQHVIYVLKGDQTFDSILGDATNGNGDKSKVRFDETVTPNQHALARQFILFDNFYSNGDSAAEGQNWAMASIAPDFTVKLAPGMSAGQNRPFALEGGELANLPPAGYLWSNALQAGLTIRNYGEWVTNTPTPQAAGQHQVARVDDLSIAPVTDLNFRGADTNYKDADRANEFIREWKEFDASGKAPQLLIVRLSNDTAAASASQVSDNDHALGMLADAVTHSTLWASTAIFVVQGSGGGEPDHIDPHRTPFWVLSPYTHRGTVDHSIFNQSSALKTIEMIIGLRPLTHFDAGAKTLFSTFSNQPADSAFAAITPKS
jgi:DNA-binding beta-propeller fold protein YncE